MFMEIDKFPSVSVIIPVYNVEVYLKRCLDSVISQTYYNLEIILVDDGSTDSSGNICEKYAEKDSRIKVIHKENGGSSDARNVGIRIASADFIAFVDSDDYVEKQYIQHLVEILITNKADIAICGYCSGKREKFPAIKRYSPKVQCFDSKVILEGWHGKYKHLETVPWNKLYRKSLFVKNEIYYPIGNSHEDVQITHLLVDKALKIVLTNAKLYYYYKRKDSISNVISEKEMQDNIYSQNIRLNFFNNNKYRKAYERLAIKLQKQYMLNYLNSVCGKTLVDVSDEMLRLFNKNYKNVCKFDSIKIWDFFLFLMFNYLHRFIRIICKSKKNI